MIGPGFAVCGAQVPQAPVAAPGGQGDDHIGGHIPSALRQRGGDGRLKLGVLAVIVAAGAGLAKATERIQSMLGYRTGDPMDFLSDMTGILAGGLMIAAFILFKKENRK